MLTGRLFTGDMGISRISADLRADNRETVQDMVPVVPDPMCAETGTYQCGELRTETVAQTGGFSRSRRHEVCHTCASWVEQRRHDLCPK